MTFNYGAKRPLFALSSPDGSIRPGSPPTSVSSTFMASIASLLVRFAKKREGYSKTRSHLQVLRSVFASFVFVITYFDPCLLFQFRSTTGRDKNSYYHKDFLRGKSELAHKIMRIKIKGKGTRKPSSPTTEPDFYAMPYLPDIEFMNRGPSRDQQGFDPIPQAAQLARLTDSHSFVEERLRNFCLLPCSVGATLRIHDACHCAGPCARPNAAV